MHEPEKIKESYVDKVLQEREKVMEEKEGGMER